MKYCINTSMLPPELNLLQKIKIASDAGFHAVEPWMEEIEALSPNDILKCCHDYNIAIPTVEQIRGWFENDGELMGVADNHTEIMAECKRRMEICASIESPWIIGTPAFSHRNHFGSWEQGVDYFRELLEIGQEIGCLPTIEFMGQTAQINTFDLCKKFIEDVGNATMVIDSYHLWRGGGTVFDFAGFDKNKISALHMSDADKNIERTQHMDRNRVMPLDGKIDLHGFIQTAKDIGYEGYINLGVYNKSLWLLPPEEVAKVALERLVLLIQP